MLYDFPARRVEGGFDDGLVLLLCIRLARNRSEVLVASLVTNVQNDAPDEIGSKPTQQHHHQYRQALP